MNPQELSIELPSQGARRATGEGSKNGWQKPQRFSARQKTEVVLRLLRGKRSIYCRASWGYPLPVSQPGVRRSSTRARKR